MAGKTKVMVVDDDPTALARAGEVLRAAGYHAILRGVAIGTAGAILRDRPALVFLEVDMPLLSGAEIAATLRANEILGDTKLVLWGKRTQEELEAMGEVCRAEAILTKPVPATSLLRTVREILKPQSRRPNAESSTRLRAAGYVLVAGNDATCRLLRATLGDRTSILFTDSGTEALRLICSRDAPRMVVLGTSITDLPRDLIWRKAVEVDPAWRERLVIAEERPEDNSTRFRPEMLRWRLHEPDRVLTMFAQLDKAI